MLSRLFGAARFSVSRLAIAVADAVTLAWLGAVAAVVPLWPTPIAVFAAWTVAITLAASFVIVLAARSTVRPQGRASRTPSSGS